MSEYGTDRPTGLNSERGTSLVELLCSTAIGLVLAGLCAHALTTYHAAYGAAAIKIDRDQQAHLALALMSAELDTIIRAPQSTGCPGPGVQVVSGRVEFSANPYDRETALRDPSPQGARQVAVDSGGMFEVGDTILLVDTGTAWDPADDASQCVRITNIDGLRLSFDGTLVRPFPSRSPVTLVNRLKYRLDANGRLMRTQDGGTQRIAENVAGFEFVVEQSGAVIRVTMRGGALFSRRVLLEAVR